MPLKYIHKWTTEDTDRLTVLYPTADKSALLLEFPGLSWGAIKSKAQYYSIRRKRSKDYPVHPLIRELITIRQQKGLSRETIAKSLNYTRQSLYFYETGRRFPKLDQLTAWAKVLNHEFILIERKKP